MLAAATAPPYIGAAAAPPYTAVEPAPSDAGSNNSGILVKYAAALAAATLLGAVRRCISRPAIGGRSGNTLTFEAGASADEDEDELDDGVKASDRPMLKVESVLLVSISSGSVNVPPLLRLEAGALSVECSAAAWRRRAKPVKPSLPVERDVVSAGEGALAASALFLFIGATAADSAECVVDGGVDLYSSAENANDGMKFESKVIKIKFFIFYFSKYK